MTELAYLERLPVIEDEISERWLARAGTSPPHVVAVIAHDDPPRLDEAELATTPWLGFRHRAVGSVRAVTRLGRTLVCDVDDDRGPSFLQAAAHLPPEERVPWALDAIAGIADALAAMSRYLEGFVHRRLAPTAMVVGPDGRLRLRAPVAHVARTSPSESHQLAAALKSALAPDAPPDLASLTGDRFAAAAAPGRARLAAWWASAPPPVHPSLDLFGARCQRHWAELMVTPRDDVRQCTSCRQPVIRVAALGLVPLAGRPCGTVRTGCT